MEEKQVIFTRCANAVGIPIDLVTGKVLLELSELVDIKGSTISMQDIDDLIIRNTQQQKQLNEPVQSN